MPHHKRAAAHQTSLPPFLLYCALRVLLLCRAHVQAHVLRGVLLFKEHELVTADLGIPGLHHANVVVVVAVLLEKELLLHRVAALISFEGCLGTVFP